MAIIVAQELPEPAQIRCGCDDLSQVVLQVSEHPIFIDNRPNGHESLLDNNQEGDKTLAGLGGGERDAGLDRRARAICRCWCARRHELDDLRVVVNNALASVNVNESTILDDEVMSVGEHGVG